MTILLSAPLAKEQDAMRQALQTLGHPATPAQFGAMTGWHIKSLRANLIVGGHGKVQYAIGTQHALFHMERITGLICYGAAGGLADQVNIADAVVATTTIEHDYTLRFTKRPPPRFDGHHETIERLRQRPRTDSAFHVHFGPVASGDEDIVEAERAASLHQQTQALAVAWEGAGGARVAAFNHLPYLELRGITDTANNHAPVDFKQNLTQAISHLAELIIPLCHAVGLEE